MDAYRHPEYYDIAFAVADVAGEVGFLAKAVAEFSRVPVRWVLQITGGTAPCPAECRTKLAAARAKAARRNCAADFVAADLRDFVTARMSYQPERSDSVAQTHHECLTLAVDDHGTRRQIAGRVPIKMFFPQEFLCFVELGQRFEFVGWFNDFDLAAPLTPQGRQIAILRRR